MAIMAKWGSKTFEVSPTKIDAIKNLSTSFTAKKEESESQKANRELATYSFDIDLNVAVGVDVEGEINVWKSLIGGFTSPILLHGRQFTENLILKTVSISSVLLDDFGRIRSASIGLEFEEVNQPDTSTAEGAQAAATEDQKAQLKIQQLPIKEKVIIGTGSKVKFTGQYYVDGQVIQEDDKARILTVGQINGTQAYISEVQGWVYTSTLSLVQ